MSTAILADFVRDPNTRLGRAVRMLDEFGPDAVERVSETTFNVLSSDGTTHYEVVYGDEEESCACWDFHRHGHEEPCKHLLLVGILSAKKRRKRARKAYCMNCRSFFPFTDVVEIGDDFLMLSEGDRLCYGCADRLGVL